MKIDIFSIGNNGKKWKGENVNLLDFDVDVRPEDMYGGMEKHHIVHKGQQGCDYDLNLIMLPAGFHKGSRGPHGDRKVDEMFRKAMQKELEALLTKEYYKLEEIIALLKPWNRKSRIQMENRIKKNNTWTAAGYQREGIIRALMGGKMEGTISE